MPTTPAKTLRKEIPKIDSENATPTKYSLFGFSPKGIIEAEFFRQVDKSGLIITEELRQRVKVEGGIISSPDFVKLKGLLGLKIDKDADAMNEQLERAMKNRAVIESINEYIKEYGFEFPPKPKTPPKKLPDDPATGPTPQGALTAEMAMAVAALGDNSVCTTEVTACAVAVGALRNKGSRNV